MKITPSLIGVALLLAISLPISASGAIIWSGSVEATISGEPAWGNLADYPVGDLSDLGTTDWAYFGVSGNMPVFLNSKSGGTALTTLTSNRDGVTNSNLALFDAATAVAHFDFIDGSSPATGSNVNAGVGARGYQPWNGNPLPVFNLTVPVISSDSLLYLWTVNSNSSMRIEAFDGATEIGTEINYAFTGDASVGRLIKLTYGGADEPGDLTFRVSMASGNQDHAYLGLAGAALSVVPEPSVTVLLGLGLFTLVLSRRRTASR
ncbi:MAG: PEP-CTERM sorting domain-containing protein [Candidatus Competibacteraceae bacterium]|nr:PEP-CTERM sorting domain-containing protein [Candidatus Competibacteraceae bacterium]